MSGLFGTDGVRGIPGKSPLDAAGVERLGAAAAKVLSSGEEKSPVLVVARDTRASGARLTRQLANGFSRFGWEVVDLGVAPTPAVSYLASRMGARAGAVVSASHNPAEYNGIKFFDARGFKGSVAFENRVESALGRLPAGRARQVRLRADAAPLAEYVDFLRSTFPATADLEGVRLVVDCAHGAAARIAPDLFRSLGADVVAIGDRPNGKNINRDCGAVHTERLRREVLRRNAHAGVAFDGDADRAVFSDERGRLLDGDAILALAATHLDQEGMLRGRKVVLTVMSNLGLVRALERLGIGTVSVGVGDRNVTDAIEKEGLVLGGENSGHVVFRKFAPTGDGMLTALQTLAAWRQRGGALSAVRRLYAPFPQLLTNVRVGQRVPLERLAGFRRELERAERTLRETGRVFVRYSGTEPLLRILVEAKDRTQLRAVSERLARTFREGVAQVTAAEG